MQSQIVALLSVLSVASAAPQVKPRATIGLGEQFGLTALRSGSAVHLQSIQAAGSQLFIGLDDQNATCDTESNFATFQLVSDGSVALYSTDAPFQELYVDASGMGQGAFGYTTGAQSAPRNGQRVAFELDSADDLTFNNQSFTACPYKDGAYSIWVNTGVANPGGNTNCTGISLRATKADSPVSCLYSESL